MMGFPKLFSLMIYKEVYKTILSQAERIKYDVWVGEWSLATDMCGMWLAGFNDRTIVQPFQYDCQMVECPHSYLPDEFAVDFDRTAEQLGPFASGQESLIKKGMCPIDSAHWSEEQTHDLAQFVLSTFNKHVEGQFMWNFRNEMEDKWNYVTAYDKGWIKQGSSDTGTSFIEQLLQ